MKELSTNRGVSDDLSLVCGNDQRTKMIHVKVYHSLGVLQNQGSFCSFVLSKMTSVQIVKSMTTYMYVATIWKRSPLSPSSSLTLIS